SRDWSSDVCSSDLIQALAFYLFAAITVASAVMVISSRNPVHSVLFLILAFFNAAGLFVLLGAEFLAMILVVVYVGAVAVLFLFVVMMLDADVAELRHGFLQYLPVGALVGLILLVELAMVAGAWAISPEAGAAARFPSPPLESVAHTAAIGGGLFVEYLFLFLASGLVLPVAMVGAIVLTLRRREGVRGQVISEQIGRRRGDTIEVKDVASGSGV